MEINMENKMSKSLLIDRKTREKFQKANLPVDNESIRLALSHYIKYKSLDSGMSEDEILIRYANEELDFSTDKAYKVTAKELYDHYTDYCFLNGFEPVGKIKFIRSLENSYDVSSRYVGKNVKTLFGLRIKR